jgi:hypothetical protein
MCLDPASTAPASRDAASDPASGPHSGQTTSVYAAERVLGALRDTDVLARVDEHEFYLLLPETSGAGASVCRRRVLEHLGAPGGLARLSDGSGLDITLGVATYPHDGTDLSQLLRVARHRAERSAQSVVRRLGLARMNLDDALDALAWAADGEGADIDAPRSIELPALDLVGLAVSALNEARRGGKVRAVCTTRSGVSTGAALRAALGREDDGEVRLEVVDVSHLEGQRDLEVFGFIAEHASYVLAGRASRGVVRAVHASDPLLVDLLLARLGDLVGHRLGD